MEKVSPEIVTEKFSMLLKFQILDFHSTNPVFSLELQCDNKFFISSNNLENNIFNQKLPKRRRRFNKNLEWYLLNEKVSPNPKRLVVGVELETSPTGIVGRILRQKTFLADIEEINLNFSRAIQIWNEWGRDPKGFQVFYPFIIHFLFFMLRSRQLLGFKREVSSDLARDVFFLP